MNDSICTTIESCFSVSGLEESTFNGNDNFSSLDFSQIPKRESTIQNMRNISEPKLSITLEQEERDILKQKYNNGHSSVTIVTQANGSLNDISDTLKEATINNHNGLHIKELTIKINGDESVIPVEEDVSESDDDVMEISTLESSVVETPQKDMFSHLQPIKTAVESHDSMEETYGENDAGVSIIEEEPLHFLQDESKLFNQSFIELGRRLWPSTQEKQQYTKGCLWSPDGTCLLVPVHLDGMHVVELPTDLYTLKELSANRGLSDLSSAVHVKEGGTVYDCCWYPYMNSSDPATCCWLATRQHEPIHMWDAFSGELRCSYRGYDEVDEVESAISVIFSNDAQKVIGGYKKTIKIFDTNMPGRDCSTIPVKKAVSCFALTTDNDKCVTAGTWTGYINHYDLRAPKLGTLFTLGGHSGGITWLRYLPTIYQSWYLFSGARKDNKILQWDMRNYTEPLQIFERNVKTNQRIYYDLTPQNTWIASGDTDGLLRIWNLGDKDQQFEINLHQDCCNGVSFHPTLPLLTTTSGQYHFVDDTETKSGEIIVNYENSLLFLWYGPSEEK